MSELTIVQYTDILKSHNSVHFEYNGFYYEIFKSADNGYVVNMYCSNERDDDGYYLEKNLIDGGVCYGNAMDAIRFMI